MKKSKGGLGALIFILPIRMQAITAAACCRVVDREVQVVSPEKPFKGKTGFPVPAFLPSNTERLQTGRDHPLCLHRLLVEPRAFTIHGIKPIGADGDKMTASRLRLLQFCQPTERFQSHFGHPGIGYRMPAHKQGVRQRCIAIGQFVLEPMPPVPVVVLVEAQQPFRQLLLHLVDAAVTGKTL